MPLSDNGHISFREWLTVLPWDLIYALGAVVLVVLLTLMVAVIGLL